MNFMDQRNTRASGRTYIGKLRGGKLVPVLAEAVRPSESGMLAQRLTMELDPIPGRLLTPPQAEMIAVFVPVQAIDAIKDPEAAYAGMTEVIREKLLSGVPLFAVENEGEITKRCGVAPKSVAGAKKVTEAVRLAHNAAVNYLRNRKYEKALNILHSNTAITPALIGQTVLDRLNGVLDPDDRINGAVDLELPTMRLPVSGVGLVSSVSAVSNVLANWSNDPSSTATTKEGRTSASFAMETTAAGVPEVFATLNGVTAGNVSLLDFYNAETRDKLTRVMRQIMDENPEYGDEFILRWAHGLAVDNARMPWVLAEETKRFVADVQGAMDGTGIQSDVMRTDNMVTMDFAVPIPKTELGGIIITFATLKPDETLAAQPHPFLSDPWGLDNYVADELMLDPVPVTIREIDADCAIGDEATVALYTGYRHLQKKYVQYGFTRQVDPNTVDNKAQIWQLEIPVSVTPENILYPADLDHWPFAVSSGEVCTYRIESNMSLRTPIKFGPTPVEALAVIDTEDLFEEEA